MSKILSKGLTFDDVLLVPAYSEVTPDVVDVTAWLTPSISLNICLLYTSSPIFLFLPSLLPKRNAMNPLIWQKRLRPLLTPVSLLYRRILAARRAKWENEGSPAFRPACPCVSVGNIAWGGTGKTPVVDWLLGWSEVRGLRAVVLSRGYKAQPPELPLHVSPSRTPGEAGDEPLMLALEHPSAAVMVDPDRRRSGRWAEAVSYTHLHLRAGM